MRDGRLPRERLGPANVVATAYEVWPPPARTARLALLDTGLFTIQRTFEHCKESLIGRVAASQPFEY